MLIIEARYKAEPEEFTVWGDRECPECRWCDCDMDYIGETNDPDLVPGWYYTETDWPDEIWQCPRCSAYDTFMHGMYGDREIRMTRTEWDERESLDRQRWYLMKRYGMYNPARINDYWITTA